MLLLLLLWLLLHNGRVDHGDGRCDRLHRHRSAVAHRPHLVVLMLLLLLLLLMIVHLLLLLLLLLLLMLVLLLLVLLLRVGQRLSGIHTARRLLRR